MIRIRVERFRIGLTIPASMPKITTLDKQWQQLMSLCESESRFRAQGSHPRLLNLVASEIDQLAAPIRAVERRSVAGLT